MTIPLRTEDELVKLREACKLASDVLVMIEPYRRTRPHLPRIHGERAKSDSRLFELSRFPESNLYFH